MLKSFCALLATALWDRESAPGFYNPYRVDKTNPFDPPPPAPYKD